MAGHGGVRRRSATLGVAFAVTIVLLAIAGGLAPSLLPDTLVGRDAQSVAAAAIFAASYLALAVGRAEATKRFAGDSPLEETGFEPSVPPARVSSVVAPCLFEATR
jgi:hypothetical protein